MKKRLMQMKQRRSILVEESHENDHNAGHFIFDEKVWSVIGRVPRDTFFLEGIQIVII